MIENNKHIRECPSCGCILSYSSKWNMNRSENNQSLCSSCWQIGEKNHIFGKSSWNKGLPKERQPRYGKLVSDKFRKMMSVKMSGKNNHRFGKPLSKEHKQKLRISIINRIQKYGIHSKNFNPKACQFIEEYGKKNGYNFQHAMNGGEIMASGYSLDGYDKEKNIIFEYDENHHNLLSKKKKDLIRQQNIINSLNPKLFLRYDEKNNKLYDVITNQNILL